MRPHLLLTGILAALLLAGCGNSTPPRSSEPGSEATEPAMNIDEAQSHYRDVIQQIRDGAQCDGTPMAWQEIEPESVEGAESDEQGDYTAYIYRGPFLGSDVACHGEDFVATVKRISTILEDNGGLTDDVVLDDSDDHAEGGEVKWLDNNGATFTFSSGAKSSFSMVSGVVSAT